MSENEIAEFDKHNNMCIILYQLMYLTGRCLYWFSS